MMLEFGGGGKSSADTYRTILQAQGYKQFTIGQVRVTGNWVKPVLEVTKNKYATHVKHSINSKFVHNVEQ